MVSINYLINAACSRARQITVPSIISRLEYLTSMIDITKRSLQYTRMVFDSYNKGPRSPTAMRTYALLGGSIVLVMYNSPTMALNATLPDKVMAYAKAFLNESKKVFDTHNMLNILTNIAKHPYTYILPFAFAATAYYYKD